MLVTSKSTLKVGFAGFEGPPRLISGASRGVQDYASVVATLSKSGSGGHYKN